MYTVRNEHEIFNYAALRRMAMTAKRCARKPPVLWIYDPKGMWLHTWSPDFNNFGREMKTEGILVMWTSRLLDMATASPSPS